MPSSPTRDRRSARGGAPPDRGRRNRSVSAGGARGPGSASAGSRGDPRRGRGELAERGPAALHAELDPDSAQSVDPNDRKRIARLTELARAGIEAARGGEGIWTAELRHPTLLVGPDDGPRAAGERIDARVDEMVAAGAAEEARRAEAAGPRARHGRRSASSELVSDIGDRRRAIDHEGARTARTLAASSPGCGGWRA